MLMGLDTRCAATYGSHSSVGRAQLEADHVRFRGEFRLKLPLTSISAVAVRDGVLSLTGPEGTLALALGSAADRWAAKIRSPKSRVEKLGVKPGMRVSVLGVGDDGFLDELRAAGADVSSRSRRNSDQVYIVIEAASDLSRFAEVLPSLSLDGAIWAIRRKGLADASEAATMAAGKAAGLVDVKVARFSDTHTAEKFVRPVRARRPAPPSRTARQAATGRG